jgi:hypothetical protein
VQYCVTFLDSLHHRIVFDVFRKFSPLHPTTSPTPFAFGIKIKTKKGVWPDLYGQLDLRLIHTCVRFC